MFRVVSLTLIAAPMGLLMLLPHQEASGCAAVPKRDGPSISIAEESAVIVWDPVNKVQHFIRRAAFDTKSPDFGFLVPTPTLPKLPLAEVEDSLFSQATSWLVPKTVVQRNWNFEPMLCMLCLPTKSMTMKAGMAPKDRVRVLHEQKVGGFETAILEADNTTDLANWLSKNGYSNDPELQSWLVPYVASKWKITAFKISQDPKTGQLATTKAVRMSFATERPFFPYREPEGKPARKDGEKGEGDANPPARLLRVLFVSNARMEGKLGDRPWRAEVPWSDELTDEQRKTLAKEAGIPETDLPAKVWLTSFEDRSSPRPGNEEVYFDPAKDATPIRPQVIHFETTWVPVDFMALVVLGVVIFGVAVVWYFPRTRGK